MKTLTLTLLAGCAALAVGAPAFAQDGPTLQATVDFLQQKVANEGLVSYTATYTDTTGAHNPWSNQIQDIATNVVGDAAGCKLTYHWKATRDGSVTEEKDAGIPFSLVTDVQVQTADKAFMDVEIHDGHPEWVPHISPSTYIMAAYRQDGSVNMLYFTDESMADRVAKAVAHAAQLCGGLKPEAF